MSSRKSPNQRDFENGPSFLSGAISESFCTPTSAKVPQTSASSIELLTVTEAATRYGKSVDTITRWCKEGRIPSVPKRYEKKVTYVIPALSISLDHIESLSQPKHRVESEPTQSQVAYIETWVQAMRTRLITGRPYSDYTVTDYEKVVQEFLTNHKQLTYDTFEKAMLSIPPNHYAKRFRLYKGLVCFAKFLFKRDAIQSDFLMQVKPLYPKRHRPPKRTGITETEFNTLLANAQTPFLRMALVILVGTGLRAGEAVALRWNKVDLDKGIVPHGPLRKMGQDKAARTRSGCD